jgi:hypothetical protein
MMVDLRLELLHLELARRDGNGKPCGNSHIPKGNECHAGKGTVEDAILHIISSDDDTGKEAERRSSEIIESGRFSDDDLDRMFDLMSDDDFMDKMYKKVVKRDSLSARLDAISRAKTINGVNYALNKNSRWERVKSGVAHGAVHLGENMAAWKVGKVVGGAIGQVAASHGADPEVARLLSETAVQALTSTALYVRSGKRSGTDIATHMIAQSAAAFSGKISHTGVDDLSEMLGGSERVQAISALVAGKMAGIGTVVAAHKSGVARKLAEGLPAAKTRIGSLIGSDAILERSGQRRAVNARSDSNPRKPLNLAEVDNAAELVMMGYAIAALDKYRGDSMDLALDLLRFDLARMDKGAASPAVKKCGRGWEGTKPPGCTQKKREKKAAPGATPTESPTTPKAAAPKKTKAKPVEPAPSTQAPAVAPKAQQKFGAVNDKKEFNQQLKEWGAGIKEVEQHAALEDAVKKVKGYKDDLADIDKTPFKPRYIFDITSGVPGGKIPMRTKAEYQSFLEKKIDDFEKTASKLSKKLKTELSVPPDRVAAASTIYSDLKESLSDKRNKPGGVLGEDGKMKAAYTYRDAGDSLYVDFLVTAPGNLLKGDTSGKGSGTEAVKQLVQKSIEAGKGGSLSLLALDDAIPFYKRLGFEGDDDSLTLSPAAARKLLGGDK